MCLSTVEPDSLLDAKDSGVYDCEINFGPGYRVYFGKEGKQTVLLLGGGTQNNANRMTSSLHWNGGKTTSREEAAERNKRGVNMALTRDFRETVQARVKRDAAFRKELLSGGPSKAFSLATCQSAKSYCVITSMLLPTAILAADKTHC